MSAKTVNSPLLIDLHYFDERQWVSCFAERFEGKAPRGGIVLDVPARMHFTCAAVATNLGFWFGVKTKLRSRGHRPWALTGYATPEYSPTDLVSQYQKELGLISELQLYGPGRGVLVGKSPEQRLWLAGQYLCDPRGSKSFEEFLPKWQERYNAAMVQRLAEQEQRYALWERKVKEFREEFPSIRITRREGGEAWHAESVHADVAVWDRLTGDIVIDEEALLRVRAYSRSVRYRNRYYRARRENLPPPQPTEAELTAHVLPGW